MTGIARSKTHRELIRRIGFRLTKAKKDYQQKCESDMASIERIEMQSDRITCNMTKMFDACKEKDYYENQI